MARSVLHERRLQRFHSPGFPPAGGESQLFGTVRVKLNELHPSLGRVGPSTGQVGSTPCRIGIHPLVELPDMKLVLTTNGQEMMLGSSIIQIPPIGDVARSTESRQLFDEHGQSVGELISADIEVGELLHQIPLGTTVLDQRFNRDFGIKK